MDGLTVKRVSVAIKDELILDDITFSLQPGSITALIGHNGAGKSTLMKTILGWQEKKTGMISLNGVIQDDDFITFKQQLAYIPEEPFLLSELTSMQHFQLYGQSYQIVEQQLNQLIDYYVRQLEIEDKLHEYPESLSKGMRQKVQTICAMIPDVPLMLIDEPFMGLDIYASDFLQKVMVEKAEKGTAILLTSHQLERVQHLADDYIMLQQGKIVDHGEMSRFDELKRRFD